MGELFIAVVLGLVEGITEFLPVSSTGHLIVAGHLLDFHGEKAKSFDVFIQLGAILSVVVLYWRRFFGLIPVEGLRWDHYKGFAGLRGISLLLTTTVPALVVGLLVHGAIKRYLFSPVTVAAALALGGIAILVAERYKPKPVATELEDMTHGQALVIGLFQCIAMWPGVSRSAATIVGGLLTGLDRRVATEYSFLAAVPVMVAAVSYDLYKALPVLQASDLDFFAVGFVVSFVSAAAAVKTFIAMVQRWSLAPYAWYRLAIAPIIWFTLR